jgi:iron complex transport system substrate-binding protein
MSPQFPPPAGSGPRVASLLPSATEMVCAVGARDTLVGVSHECDFPAGVSVLPVLTSSKVFTGAPSAEVDRNVRELLKDALAVYDIDTAELERCAPDVIVTQDLCDVCAVSFADVEAAVKSTLTPDVRIVNLHPKVLADVWSDIRAVGSALGRDAQAAAFLDAADARIAKVADRAKAISDTPNVLTIEWLEPVMVGGTWMPELVTLAGGHALVTTPGEHAPTLSALELCALDPAPDVVVIKPCGFKLEQTRKELDTIDALLANVTWPAATSGRVYVADGNAFFNRPGPRLVESLEIMAACVHPTEFADLAEKHATSFFKLDAR